MRLADNPEAVERLDPQPPGRMSRPGGEWIKARVIGTEYQHVTGNDLDEFCDLKKLVIVGLSEYRTADLIYPQDAAGK